MAARRLCSSSPAKTFSPTNKSARARHPDRPPSPEALRPPGSGRGGAARPSPPASAATGAAPARKAGAGPGPLPAAPPVTHSALYWGWPVSGGTWLPPPRGRPCGEKSPASRRAARGRRPPRSGPRRGLALTWRPPPPPPPSVAELGSRRGSSGGQRAARRGASRRWRRGGGSARLVHGDPRSVGRAPRWILPPSAGRGSGPMVAQPPPGARAGRGEAGAMQGAGGSRCLSPAALERLRQQPPPQHLLEGAGPAQRPRRGRCEGVPAAGTPHPEAREPPGH